eukprot:TRINITY_DN3718_c0_g1_i2.p2 TRINITY_DN3718_c0_g1~~TRINITY_DN3718_c0_g1_i2.p2  ORF type:complete len:168 (-),score=31.43 TRINITY_DN3718_c0_g1_i2:569-1072(-)
MIKIPPQYMDDDHIINFAKEVEVVSNLHHPNIVQIMGACITHDNLFLVTEYVIGGSIREQLDCNPTISYDQIYLIAINVAAGMKYLHSLLPPIIHRDLKLANILRDETTGISKITDFGSATLQHKDRTLTNAIGTPQYMAPEVIISKKYTLSVDVWSYGVILWELGI